MPPFRVVKSKIIFQRHLRRVDIIVGLQVYLLVFDAAPEPLDEHVINPATLATHADFDVMSLQDAGKVIACKLTALISVEDLGRAVGGDSILQSFNTEAGMHGV